MLKQLGLAALMLFGLAATTEAQQRIFVRQNGCTVIVMTMPKHLERHPRCDPPRKESRRDERRERRGKARVLIPMPSCGRYDPVLHVFRPRCL